MTEDQKDEAAYLANKAWLKEWGQFQDGEVENYPWCLVDVLSIMQEKYEEGLRDGRAQKLGVKA